MADIEISRGGEPAFDLNVGRNRWIRCVVGDAAGDFVFKVRSASSFAHVGFSMQTAKRLISTLKSRGGSRFNAEANLFSQRLNHTPNSFLVVRARPNGSYDFVAAEEGGQSVTVENGVAALEGEAGLYPAAKINVSAKHVEDLITSMVALIKVVPPEIEKHLADAVFDSDHNAGARYRALVNQGRYDEALDFFYTTHKAHCEASIAESRARYDAMSPEDKAESDARRANIIGRILESLKDV